MALTVTIPYDPLWKPLDWAKEHCPSYITNDMHCDGYNSYDLTKVDYFFSNKKDAIMFMLKWAQ